MRLGGSYTKEHKDAEPKLVSRTKTMIEHKEEQAAILAKKKTKKVEK